MIPNIFISSTISDLHHLRDAVRDTIQELHYIPRMSEYGDLGYVPSTSAVESCYLSIKECHLFVLIIGKKYGNQDKNGLSVTHNEFRTAKELKLPIICLLDQEVNTFKQVFEANPKKKMKYPGMDNPDMTFQFIQEFSNYSENNGFLVYKTIFDARNNLKNQIAHIFCDLLVKRYDSIRSEIKDVLAEISTLRHMLLKNDEEKGKAFARVTRLLLDENFKQLKEMFDKVYGGIENAVPNIIKYSTFSYFISETNTNYKISSEIEKVHIGKGGRENIPKVYTYIQWVSLPLRTPRQMSSFSDENIVDIELEQNKPESAIFAYGKKYLWTNVNGDRLLNALYGKLKKTIENIS